MADQFAGPSMKTPAISTPLLPMSPLPSMDVLMHSPGLLYSSPGQDGKASNDDAPPVQKALPREVTLSKLDQAEKLVSDVRQGAQDLIAALRETAKLTSAPAGAISEEPPVSRPKRALSSSDEGTAAKRSRIASAGGDKQLDQADVSTEDDAEVTPVSLVISKVEAALAELAGLGKELTEAGVSFLPSSVRGAKAEPDGEFAVREWDALVAERKAKCEMDNVQAALRKVHSQLRQRFEDDRETVSEIDKVMKGLSAADPDKVSGALQLLRENGVLEGGELSEGGSVIEKLERVQKAAGWMEMELVAESEKVLWHSSGGGSAVGGSAEGEDKGGVLEDRPACLRCLLPGVLRATVGVSKEGQPTTVSVTDTNQVRKAAGSSTVDSGQYRNQGLNCVRSGFGVDATR